MMVLMDKKLGAISVRLNERQHSGLKNLSQTTGLDPAQLIRTAVDGLIDYANAHGGRLTLPLDFTKFFTELKGLLDDDTPQVHSPPMLKVAETGEPMPQPAKKSVSYRGQKR